MKAKKPVVAATMKDVALQANVSTATVSRALMNPEKVSQATRNRVEQAALEVGYLPQMQARLIWNWYLWQALVVTGIIFG